MFCLDRSSLFRTLLCRKRVCALSRPVAVDRISSQAFLMESGGEEIVREAPVGGLPK